VSGIGLVVALPRELPARCVRSHDHHERAEPSPFPVYQYKTAPGRLTVVQTGIGQRRAAHGARWLVRQFSPCALVSFGFAGGLNPQLRRGTLVIGTALIADDSSRVVAEAQHRLIDQFQTAAEAEGLPVQQGSIVTTERVVADTASKAAFWRQSGACAVDMETAGVVQVAREVGLPWGALRAVVDCASDPLPAGYLAALRGDGRVAVGGLVRTLCRSPSLIRPLFTLAAGTTMARRHLSRVLMRWAADPQNQAPLG
jgi:adenosylhomocysteine nucleosidase